MEAYLKQLQVKVLSVLNNQIMKMKLPKVIFLAQTPPPYLGQSIMHEFLINSDWSKINKKHIRLNLSDKSDQFGNFSIKKILNIAKVILQFWFERMKGKIDLLYYPPSGPVCRKTFYKDLSLLLFTRILVKKTVFHFHADKFDDLQNKLNKFELIFAKLIYQKPDLCIVIVEPQVADIKWLSPKKIVVIPNGIEDNYNCNNIKKSHSSFNILYIGLLVPYKGIECAIYTSKILMENKYNFKWTFVGGWSSASFKNRILSLVEILGLNNHIVFVGEKIKDEKWKYFEESDVLCLPTYTDLMPLCVIEGMMMSLPIVTTNLRTLPFVVDANVNGLLSPPEDPEKLFLNIEYLYNNREISKKMGQNARLKFKHHYSIENHLEKMQNAIYELLNG